MRYFRKVWRDLTLALDDAIDVLLNLLTLAFVLALGAGVPTLVVVAILKATHT